MGIETGFHDIDPMIGAEKARKKKNIGNEGIEGEATIYSSPEGFKKLYRENVYKSSEENFVPVNETAFANQGRITLLKGNKNSQEIAEAQTLPDSIIREEKKELKKGVPPVELEEE